MPDIRDAVQALVAADQLEEAAVALAAAAAGHAELAPELVVLQSGLKRVEASHRRGLMDDDEYGKARTRAGYALLGIVDELEAAAGAPPGDGGVPTTSEPGAPDPAIASPSPRPSPTRSPRIFLSYNHADGEAASGLREALRARGVTVHIDREAMAAGEAIRGFIERSIRETDATVCLISNRSLASAWVAMETVDAFYAERGPGGRRFIACYLDDDFFSPRFRLEATERIDAKIAEIDSLMPDYVEKKLDTNDLNAEKSRLYALRNGLGDILLRLKESLTLDARVDGLDRAAEHIARTLRGA